MEETHGKGRQWYGFTEDQVFGEVMNDREICKYILQMLLPDRVIDEIYYPLKQKEIKDPSHRHEKDVRLDILVEDNHHNLYDLEMQTTDKRDLGKRLRYYGSQLDQRYTLKKGDTYKNLQNLTLITFCTFDLKEQDYGVEPVKRWYRSYGVKDRMDELNDGKEEIIINSKGNIVTAEEALVPLVNLMEDRYYLLNNLADDTQQRIYNKIRQKITEMNADPIWRDTIMDYETKLAEEREYGEEKGILSATVNAIKKIIRRNRSYGVSDSKTLEDLTEDYHDSVSRDQIEQMMKEA